MPPTRDGDRRNGLARFAIAMLCIAALGPLGCTTPPPPDDPEGLESFQQINDPFEPLNRAIFAVNVEADRYILKPVAYVYKEAVPSPVRDIIGNFLHNLSTPVILVNAGLQGDIDHAGVTLLRFVINSTIGIAGAMDVAAEFDLVRRKEDFGQTLAVWGVGEGPYLMLPIFGPSSTRHTFGRVIDYFSNPLTYFGYEIFTFSRFAAKTVDGRVRNYELLNDLEKTSIDYYAAVRSYYRQNRLDAFRNGAEPDLPPLPEMLDEEDDLEDEEEEPARPSARPSAR